MNLAKRFPVSLSLTRKKGFDATENEPLEVYITNLSDHTVDLSDHTFDHMCVLTEATDSCPITCRAIITRPNPNRILLFSFFSSTTYLLKKEDGDHDD